MIIIGENINASIRSVAEAINSKDKSFLTDLVLAQVKAGADFIDVNAGSGYKSDELSIAAMEWLIEVVQEATDKPLVIDSDNPKVIEAGLRKYRGEKLIINSVTAEPERLLSIGSMAVEYNASLIALAMGTDGIPDNAKERLVACDQIMNQLNNMGIQPERIFFDALVLPISVDAKQAMITLKTLEQIKVHYPAAKTIVGLSNISYGLPKRKLINRAFFVMAAYAGLDATIVDPLDAKMMSFIKVATMLTGNDPMCRGYLKANRKDILVD